jgi:translation elongation factor EF-1alpha
MTVVNPGGGGTITPPVNLIGTVDSTELTITQSASPQASKPFRIVEANTNEVASIDANGSLLLGQTVGTGGITAASNIDINTAGQGLRVKEGANAKQGVTAAMVSGVVTTANTAVTANSRILYCQQSGTLTGFVSCTRTAGTSFTLTSSVATDTAVFAYQIFEPG